MIFIIAIGDFDREEKIMQLRNLITFIHVAELGSFTKAAQQLGYSQMSSGKSPIKGIRFPDIFTS